LAGQFGYFDNASAAKSQGVELAVEARPLHGTRINAWIAYDDAVLTQDVPATAAIIGAAGDRLPGSSRFSGNVSANQAFVLTSSVTGFAEATLSYVGDRKGVFAAAQSSGQRQDYPAYAKLDLPSGLTYGSWAMNVFVNNVTDKRGLLAGGLGVGIDQNGFIIIQPRTVGLSLKRTF